ncbi:MAG: hypothetical protein ACK56I_20015, partial [bacterium]
RKHNALVIREEVGRKVRAAQVGDLAAVRTIDIADHDLHARRAHQPALQERLVLGDLRVALLRREARRAEHQPLAVMAEEGAAVVSQIKCQLLLIGSVNIHNPELQIARPVAGEHNFISF